MRLVKSRSLNTRRFQDTLKYQSVRLFSNQIYKDLARNFLKQYPQTEDVRYDSYRLRSFYLGSSFSTAQIEAVQLLIDKTTNSYVEPEKVLGKEIPKDRVFKPSQTFKTLYRRGFTFLEMVSTMGLEAVTTDKKQYADELDVDREQAMFALTALRIFWEDFGEFRCNHRYLNFD